MNKVTVFYQVKTAYGHWTEVRRWACGTERDYERVMKILRKPDYRLIKKEEEQC